MERGQCGVGVAVAAAGKDFTSPAAARFFQAADLSFLSFSFSLSFIQKPAQAAPERTLASASFCSFGVNASIRIQSIEIGVSYATKRWSNHPFLTPSYQRRRYLRCWEAARPSNRQPKMRTRTTPYPEAEFRSLANASSIPPPRPCTTPPRTIGRMRNCCTGPCWLLVWA